MFLNYIITSKYKIIRVNLILLYLFSLIFKCIDIRSTQNYFIKLTGFSNKVILICLLAVIVLEFFVIIYFIWGKKIIIILTLLQVFHLIFIAINLFVIFQGFDNCGCFGTVIKVNPQITIAKNMIIIYLLSVLKKQGYHYEHKI